ncbi:WD repeat, SAM and U-box domain-containing protein 1 isoform 3-T3 [Morphnus guianensis]
MLPSCTPLPSPQPAALMPGTDTPFQPASRRRGLCHTAPKGPWTDKMIAGITWIQAAKSETWEGFGQEVWAQRGESNIRADAASVRGMTEAARSRLRRQRLLPLRPSRRGAAQSRGSRLGLRHAEPAGARFARAQRHRPGRWGGRAAGERRGGTGGRRVPRARRAVVSGLPPLGGGAGLKGGFAVPRRGEGRRRLSGGPGRAGPESGGSRGGEPLPLRPAAPLPSAAAGGRDLSLPLRKGCGGVPRRCGPCPSVCPRRAIRVGDGEHGFRYFQMASCGQDNQIKLWLILFADFLGVELKYKCTLNGHSAPVLACAFSYDGQMLVSGSVDKCVIIYETSTGNTLHTLSQHTRYVTTCAFAPYSPLLATGSMDKTVNIWQFDLKQPCAGNTVENESKVTVEDWSEDDVSAWLCAQDLADFVGLFKMNNIDGKELLNLTKESLTNELKIESLGLRSKVLQKIEELRMTTISVSVTIPDEFLCPITRELMKDPVIAADGYSYEREAMENWISTRRRSSPMTNLPLPSLILTPNRTLKMAISRWLETQQKYS